MEKIFRRPNGKLRRPWIVVIFIPAVIYLGLLALLYSIQSATAVFAEEFMDAWGFGWESITSAWKKDK
jgi:ABC-type uncharacterized transport system permease subunit